MDHSSYKRLRLLYDVVLKTGIPFLGDYVAGKLYDEEYYTEGNELKSCSAKKVAEILDAFISFDSVFDIGCGTGLYLYELHKLGKEALGCDSSAAAIEMAPKSFVVFQADATQPIRVNRRFDLVLCFEVAEHIRRACSEQLVVNCVKGGDVVCFTAAPPGQKGVGHINEQPYQFWIDLFIAQSYRLESTLSERIRSRMRTERVVSWIADNFMVFTPEGAVETS